MGLSAKSISTSFLSYPDEANRERVGTELVDPSLWVREVALILSTPPAL